MGIISEGESQITLEGLPNNSRSRRSTRRQWTAGIIASLGMWSLGSAIGWSSPTLPQLENDKGIDKLSENEVSWVASVIMLAALPGCFIGGYAADKFGRRWICIIAAFPFIGGWAIVAGAQNSWMLIVGRVIIGVSAGACSVSATVFCVEIAEDILRSKLVSWSVVALCLGILYSFIVGALVHWRINTLIGGATLLPFIVGMLIMPETPRFLVTRKKLENACKSLQWYRGEKSELDVHLEFDKLVNDVNESDKGQDGNEAKATDRIFVASTIKPVLIVLCCAAFQQLSGTSAVTFYTVDIFKAAGNEIEPNICAIIIGATQAAATGFAGILMTKFGRKSLFFFSEVGMCISLLTLGVFYYLKDHEPEISSKLGWLPLMSLVMYTITYCSGAGILPWTLMADLCPPHVKGITSAMCTATNCGLGFTVALVFPRLLSSIHGYGAFWLFSAICAVGALFMAFVLPETKDKTMDEIMSIFKKRTNSPI